jgi:hypothetical protein
MAAKTIECVECGATVAYGRLSCPDCGSLLASVAGSMAPKPAPAQAATIELQSASKLAEQAAGMPLDEPADVQADAPTGPALVQATVQAPADAPMPTFIPRQPNAFHPPMLAAATVMTSTPVWPGAVPPAQLMPDELPVGRPSTTPLRAVPWSNAIDQARALEISGWVVLAGAALGTLGFLLPWSRVVIGAGAFGGYLSTWGLASPTHLLVFLMILVVLGLAIVPTRVPAWLAFGVGGLALGGFLIGLSWPYLVGPLGADIGVLLVGLGGAILGVGGVMATWSSRHVEVEPSV